MEPAHDHAAEGPRPPLVSDLVNLCRWLNSEGARYVVVGGFAILHAGYNRSTMDIDLLVDAGPDNEARVRRALLRLPDAAVRDIAPGDLDRYVVIRVADEVVVDLMKAACGVEYAQAKDEISWAEIEGVRIPFANPRLLWKTKQTHRERDALDRAFLQRLLSEATPSDTPPSSKRGFWRRLRSICLEGARGDSAP